MDMSAADDAKGTVRSIASQRQSHEELFLAARIAKKSQRKRDSSSGKAGLRMTGEDTSGVRSRESRVYTESKSPRLQKAQARGTQNCESEERLFVARRHLIVRSFSVPPPRQATREASPDPRFAGLFLHDRRCGLGSPWRVWRRILLPA